MKLWFSLLTLFLCLINYGSEHNLSSEELEKLKGGKLLVSTKKIEGKTWPEVTVKAFIKASPLESMALFAAFDYQKTYIPKLVTSKIHKQNSPTNVEVLYELDMPWPLSKSSYIHGHHLSLKNGVYFIRWYLVKSDTAADVQGSAIAREYKEAGGTIMTYKSFIDPKSFFAGIFRKVMVKDVKKCMEEVVKIVEGTKKDRPKLMEYYKNKIIMALSGNKAY